MWSLKTGGLLTQMSYSEKYPFGGSEVVVSQRRWSLNTGGFKDRFDCTQ